MATKQDHKPVISRLKIGVSLSVRLLLISIIALYITLHGLLPYQDSNTVLNKSISPNRQFTAVIFTREYDRSATQLSIISTNDSLQNDDGNVCVEDSGLDGVFSKMSVRWQGDNKLIVEYERDAHIFKSEKSFSAGLFGPKVDIEYKYLPISNSN
jgi:hypothetical protein